MGEPTLEQRTDKSRIEIRKTIADGISLYAISLFDAEGEPGIESYHNIMREVEGHFILSEIGGMDKRGFPNDGGFDREFGIAHNPKEADTRLYDRAREVAKEYQKWRPIEIKDLTENSDR